MCLDKMTRGSISDEGKAKMKVLMRAQTDTIGRQHGNGHKTPKTHSFLHLPHYILWFGPPHNYSSGPGERNANVLAKQQANNTCRNHETFEPQVGVWLSEYIAIDSNICIYLPLKEKKVDGSPAIDFGGTTFVVTSNEDENADGVAVPVLIEKRQRKHAKSQMDLFDRHLLYFIYDELSDFMPNNEVPCFTAHKWFESIFHGHPSFRSGHEWHDWANFDWEIVSADGHVDHQIIPAQIFCFVDLHEMF